MNLFLGVVEMAFVEKVNNKWVVKQGNTGRVLSRHDKKSEAEKRVKSLHKEHKPKQKHRGSKAKKKFGSDALKKKK